MTVFVLWNVYDQGEHLAAAIASVDKALRGEQVTHVVVDGRYPDFPGDGKFSTDSTEQVAHQAGAHYVPHYGLEPEKVTRGLRTVDRVARPGDWVLRMDADERLDYLRLPDAPAGLVRFLRQSDVRSYDRARLLSWQPGLTCGPRHYEIRDRHKCLAAWLDTAPGAVLCGTGLHADGSPDREREKAKKVYYQRLTARESECV